MTRDETIRMAREAKGHAYTNRHLPGEPAFAFSIDRLERFAALVAAAEREACAKVCEETTAAWTQHLYNSGCVDCAAAIRARGQA